MHTAVFLYKNNIENKIIYKNKYNKKLTTQKPIKILTFLLDTTKYWNTGQSLNQQFELANYFLKK